MRMLMKVSIPVEAGNRATRAGTLGATVRRILEEQKPEAAYFAALDGKRTGILVLDIEGAHPLPSFAEPWLLAFDASLLFSLVDPFKKNAEERSAAVFELVKLLPKSSIA